MDWRQKVSAFVEARDTTIPKLSKRVGIPYTTLKRALDRPGAWATVLGAVRLAEAMGISVEELFDPDVDWPPMAQEATTINIPIPETEYRRIMGVLQRMKDAGIDVNELGIRQADMGKAEAEAPVQAASKIVQKHQRARGVTRKKMRKA